MIKILIKIIKFYLFSTTFSFFVLIINGILLLSGKKVGYYFAFMLMPTYFIYNNNQYLFNMNFYIYVLLSSLIDCFYMGCQFFATDFFKKIGLEKNLSIIVCTMPILIMMVFIRFGDPLVCVALFPFVFLLYKLFYKMIDLFL